MDKLTAARYFIKVADTGSFSKTAALLGQPVSTVSRRVKDLEQHLGVVLINRTTRHLSLTDLGRVYYNQVEEAVRAFELADQTIQQSSTKPSGKLKISALPSYANRHLYPILEKFRKQHPDIMVELMTTDIVHNLVTDNIDFAIRPTHKPPENLVAKVVDHHRMAIVCSPEYMKKYGPIKNWQDVINHKTICFSYLTGIMPWWAYSGNKWLTIDKIPYFVCTDTCKILDIAINGEGIALLPEWTYLESLNEGLLEIANKGWDASFSNSHDHKLYLLYDRKPSQLKRNRTFLKFFHEQLKQK
jgi:DNA-binding transcriptional LysR family regulator